MILDGLSDELLAFDIRMDAVVAEIVGIVFLLKKDGSDVNDGHFVRDRELEDLDVVALVPVRDELLVAAHPLKDVLCG